MRIALLLALLCTSPIVARAQDTVTLINQANTSVDQPTANWIAQRASGMPVGAPGHNTSIIVQNGNNNQASTDQTNGGNEAMLTQTGNSNMAALIQNSSNGTINATQTGIGIGITITQTGNAPAITITQTRPGH